MPRTTHLLLPLIFLAVTTAVPAQDDEARARFEIQMQEMADQLELTDAQRAELEPVLRVHFEELQALLEKHGLERRPSRPPGRRTLLAFRSDVQPLNQRTDAQVEEILSTAQMETYRDIQNERRARMRAQFRR